MRGNDELPTLPIGQRVKLLRERAGMSRPVLAGLVGKSPEWVKSVEMGRILSPRPAVLAQLAKALKVPVQTLIAEVDQVVLAPGPGHPALPAVRDALNRWRVPDAGQPPAFPDR
jgi:transcriptional regulator with XRE-family HTH domain